MARTPQRAPDLGLTDGLVQLSMVVAAVLEEAASAEGIPALQGRLIGALRDRRPTMAEIARLLDLDKSSTTGLVDRAERRGLVRRSADQRDGRSYRVELTSTGGRVAADLAAEVGARLADLTAELSVTNRRRLSLLVGGLVHRHAALRGVDLSAGVIDTSQGAAP